MKPVTRIMRPWDGSAPGMPKAAKPARKRKPDHLDHLLAVTRRDPQPVTVLPRIILPWPDPELWPNRMKGHHWSSSYPQKRAARLMASSRCIDAGYHLITVAPGPIRITFIACPSRNHLWDDDGLQGALKQHRDTIARALGVDDSRFDARVERGDPCRDGAVLVEIEVIQ